MPEGVNIGGEGSVKLETGKVEIKQEDPVETTQDAKVTPDTAQEGGDL